MIYQSKHSISWGILLWLPDIFLFLSGQESGSFLLNLIAIIYLVIVATAWFGTRYVIEGEFLIIKTGPFSLNRIWIASIQKVVKIRSSNFAPAWSSDRLIIFYEKTKTQEISPRNPDQFLKDLNL